MAKSLRINIQESETQLKNLLKQQKDVRKRERLQALYLLKSNQVTELKVLSAILGRDTSTLYRWLQQYKDEGLESLLTVNSPPGKSSTIPPEILQQIIEQLKYSGRFGTYYDIQSWLKEEYNLSVNYYVVYRAVRPYVRFSEKS